MWNKLTQVAGLGAAASQLTVSEGPAAAVSEMEEQIVQQYSEIQNLKVVLRENEKLFQEKNSELEEMKSKFQKFKLHSKAKICQLSNQLKELEKSTKKDDADFEDTCSSDSSDQSKRGKVIVLKKQLEQARHQVEKKEREMEEANTNFEAVMKDLYAQLDQREKQILHLKQDISQLNSPNEAKDSSRDAINFHEMYAQIVYKDSKIIELNNQILKHEQEILDLQEHIKEKDEVLLSRNRAIQLMTADMNRKGKSVVDELDEVRKHMQIMQENFTTAELEWKVEKQDFSQEIKDMKENFEKGINERDMKIKSSEEAIRNLEVTRHDLATKNAELQRKLVVVKEKADEHCKNFQKQMEEELHSLRRNTEQEKMHSMELQRALNEATNQLEARVLKARVKERTKFKALERELKALREVSRQTPDQVIDLHHYTAELEKEKGSLQLKLLEMEEKITLQEQMTTDEGTLSSCLKETKEKYVQVEVLPSEYEKGNTDLHSQFSGVKLHHEKIHTESHRGEYCQDERHLYENTTLVRDGNMYLEAKVIDSRKQEGDETAGQELLCHIHKLQDMFDSRKQSVVEQGKENNLNEKVTQLDELYETEVHELHNVIRQSDYILTELNELQNKCSNIIKENQKYKLEIELLISALKDREEMVMEVSEQRKWFTVNNPDKLKITSLLEKCSSQQVLLNDLFSMCMVRDLAELKGKCSDMIDNIKNLSSSTLEKDKEVESYKQQYEEMVDEVRKLQSDCQTTNSELKNNSELIQNLKIHIKVQEQTYSNQVNELKQCTEVQEKEKLYYTNTASEREKLLQKTITDVEEKDELIKNLTENIQQQSGVMCELEKQTVFLSGEIEVLKEAKKMDADKSQSKMSSMLEQISDLEAEVSKLQAEVSSKVQRCADLQKKSDYFKALYGDMLEDQQAHNTVCKDLKNQLESLQQQILLLESEVEKKNRGIAVQKALKNKYEAEKEIMLQVNKGSIDSLEIALNACQAEKEEMLRVSIIKESEIKELQSSLKGLNHKLDSEIKKSNNICYEHQCVIEEKKALSNQLLGVKNMVQSLKMEISNLCTLLSEKEDTSKNMLSGNVKLEVQTGDLKSEDEMLHVSDETKLENTLLIKQNSDISCQLELAKKDLSDVSNSSQYIVLENKTLEQTLVKCVESLKWAACEAKPLRKKYLILCDENMIWRQENSDLVALTKGEKQRFDKTNEKETVELLQLEILGEKSQQIERENSDMAKSVQDLQIVSQIGKEAEKPPLKIKECHTNNALQNEIKEPEKSDISIKTETVALSGSHSSSLSKLLSEVNTYHQHEVLCAKTENGEYKSQFENEANTNLYMQGEKSLHEIAGKHLKTVLMCAFQENKNLKTNLLNLKCDAQIKLHQYLCDLIHVKDEFSIVMGNIHKKVDELMTLLKNSLSENGVLKETECDLSEKLQKSCVLIQNLTREKDLLQRQMVQLEQQVDDLMRQQLVEEEQYQISLKKKQVEYEKQLFTVQKEVDHLTLLKTQYCFTADKLLCLKKCIIGEIKESTANEVPELEFPKNFYILEDIVRSIENKCIEYKHQTSEISSDVSKLCNEESLIKFRQAVQDENSSLLQRVSYLEDVKDTLVSILPSLSKKVSDIVEMNCVSLKIVLDGINSKYVTLGRMEASVMLLRKTFAVFKKQLEILQSENVSLKDQIHCNSKEILYLQNINKDLLKEKNKTEPQLEKQKMSKKLADHTELLHALRNWINQQEEKIRHMSDLLQMSLTKNALLFDKMSAENRDLQKQITHSDVKAEEMVLTKEQIFGHENLALDHIFHHNTECEEFESSRQELYLIEKKLKELMNDASLKDSTINELLKEHKTNEGMLPNLIYILKDSEISMRKLQSQIKKFTDKSNSYKCNLELCAQAKDSLQTEVQNLHSSLSTLEKEKLALEQELKSVIDQLQYTKMDYKEKINSLQTEVNKYTEINMELTEMVEEKNTSLINNQTKHDELQLYGSESVKYNTAKQKLCVLRSDFERKYKGKCSNCKESVHEDLKQNVEDMLKCNLEMKKHLKGICDMMCNKISYSPNLFSELDCPQELDYFNDDDYLEKVIVFLKNSISMIMMLLHEKQCKLQEMLSDFEMVKEEKDNVIRTLNEKTCLCEELYIKVEELKKSMAKTQSKLELSDDKIMATETGACIIQAPSFDGVDQFLTEELQEGYIEKLCCNFEGCQLANESLHHQLNVQKMKYNKMLTKFKISSYQVEELHCIIQRLKEENRKLAVSHDEFSIIQKKQLESHGKLEDDWKAAEKEKNCEIHRLQILVNELKENNSLEISVGEQLQTDLQHYKDLWEQSNSTSELQKEENEQLQLKLKKLLDELENVNLKLSELKSKCIARDAEKKYLQHTVEGLKENIDMLISDNNTFQELIEKLSYSKASLESDLTKLKENDSKEMNKLNEKLLSENNELRSMLQVAKERNIELSAVEEQYKQLESKWTSLEERRKCLESKVQDILKDKELLEKQNRDLCSELCKQTDELCHLRMAHIEGTNVSIYNQELCREKELEDNRNQFQEGELLQCNSSFGEVPMSKDLNQTAISQLHIDNQNFNSIPVTSEKAYLQGYLKYQIEELLKEKRAHELHIKYLANELQSATFKKKEAMEEYLSKEEEYKNDSTRKESQLQQQITSLQMQRLATNSHADGEEEIVQELTTNSVLKTEFQQTVNNLHQQCLRCEELSLEVSKLLEDRNDLRLKLSQWHQHSRGTVSEAFGVDNAAYVEKLPSEDYQLLLGDDNDTEHEVFADTDLFITRHVKSSSQKLHRWLRSRRNYLCRVVRSKNYCQFLYLAYLFALHVWIIVCTFGHR